MLNNQVPEVLRKDFHSLPFEYRDLVAAIINECSSRFKEEIDSFYTELNEYDDDRKSF